MDKSKQGISVRGIAREWGVSVSYVSTFLKRAGLGPFSDGSYDLVAATAARAKHTRAGKGQRKWARRHGTPKAAQEQRTGTEVAPICEGCGSHYIAEYSKNSLTPTPSRFCSASCEADCNSGLTQKEIARRRDSGISPRKLKFAKRPEYVPPPRPKPIFRTCSGCGGLYDMNSNDLQILTPDDVERFCSSNCEHMVRNGLTRAEIQRYEKTAAAEGGETQAQINAPDFFDMIKPDGSPK
jgi:hypothetical protein